MSNYNGYLLKFGNTIFPNEYLAQGHESTPFRRTDAEAYRDANHDLHRVTINNHKSTFELTTISGLTLEQKIEIDNIMLQGLQNSIERKFRVTYWNNDIGVNDYVTADFYIPDPTFTIQKITNETIIYDTLTYEFIQY